MAYIGKSPSVGVRDRYYYTTVGGETSISGADDAGRTLTFTDGKYVDVMLNGITLVAGTDYVTTTANTISGLDSLGDSDVMEIVVYDVFSIADTVSAARGGTYEGPVIFNAPVTFGDSLNWTNNLLPDSDNKYDIGSTDRRWKDGYFSGTLTADGSGIINLNIGLDSLSNVNLGTPQNGQVLTYKDSSGLFELDSAASAMAQLSDVNLTGLQDGHTIVYNAGAGEFQADSIAGGNITTNVLWENASVLSSVYSITAGNNAISAGPILVDSGGSVTVPSGSRWVVV